MNSLINSFEYLTGLACFYLNFHRVAMPLNLELTYYIGMIYHFTSTSLFIAEIAGLEPTHRIGYRLLVIFRITALHN